MIGRGCMHHGACRHASMVEPAYAHALKVYTVRHASLEGKIQRCCCALTCTHVKLCHMHYMCVASMRVGLWSQCCWLRNKSFFVLPVLFQFWADAESTFGRLSVCVIKQIIAAGVASFHREPERNNHLHRWASAPTAATSASFPALLAVYFSASGISTLMFAIVQSCKSMSCPAKA